MVWRPGQLPGLPCLHTSPDHVSQYGTIMLIYFFYNSVFCLWSMPIYSASYSICNISTWQSLNMKYCSQGDPLMVLTSPNAFLCSFLHHKSLFCILHTYIIQQSWLTFSTFWQLCFRYGKFASIRHALWVPRTCCCRMYILQCILRWAINTKQHWAGHVNKGANDSWA